MEKEYILFAGVNGAGKTTYYKHHTSLAGQPRINSDEIVVQNGGDWRKAKDQAAAMKEAVARIKDYLNSGISFNQESTLTGGSIIGTLKRAKACGYTVKMYYVGLASADLAVERVSMRVSQGGHGIEEKDIRRRYVYSLKNLAKVIPLCDTVIVLDNTEEYRQIAVFEGGRLTECSVKDCEWVKGCLLDWLVGRYGDVEKGGQQSVSSAIEFDKVCRQIRMTCDHISYVRYWWSEDGEAEICKRTSLLAETEMECSQCLKMLPRGEIGFSLENRSNGEQDIICKECAEKSCADLL